MTLQAILKCMPCGYLVGSLLLAVPLDPGYGVAVYDDATGTGYLMYSAEHVQSRFELGSGQEYQGEHWIVVRKNGSVWEYAKNETWPYFASFTPRASDILVAELNLSADTVVDYYDHAPIVVDGIWRGYASSDLQIEPNQYNGIADDGEFDLLGTYITFYQPAWWFERGVIADDPTAEDPSGLGNLGQLKHMATQAYIVMDELLPGDVGFSLASYIPPLPASKTSEWYDRQRNVAIAGQLKAVASPIYAKLNAIAPGWAKDQIVLSGVAGWSYDVPWNPSTPVHENYNTLTVGQLKLAFAMRFLDSSDGDSIPDLLEYALYGTVDGNDSGDFDQDGVTDGIEIGNGTMLWIADSDGDGVNDNDDATPLNPHFGAAPTDDETGPVITVLSPKNLP